jgi:malonate decarboxylase beta subunit
MSDFYNWPELADKSFYNATARERAVGLLDQDTFIELLGPDKKMTSPHLPLLGEVVEFDDGMVTALGKIGSRPVYVVSMEGGFIGGSIGEVNGTKMVMAILLAVETYHRMAKVLSPEELKLKGPAVVISFDTGGVRLHESNAGLLAHAEVMDALQDARNKVPVIAVIGGKIGCFGGMGFVSVSTDAIIMNEQGRIGLTGPEVIEQEMGRDEFDASDRALVWRTTGGKHKYIMRDCDFLVADTIGDFYQEVSRLLSGPASNTFKLRRIGDLASVKAQLEIVRKAAADGVKDSIDLWRSYGNANPEGIPVMPLEEFLTTVHRRPL